MGSASHALKNINMKNNIRLFIILGVFLIAGNLVFAQQTSDSNSQAKNFPPDQYYVGTVLKSRMATDSQMQPTLMTTVKISSGDEAGNILDISHGYSKNSDSEIMKGEQVVIAKNQVMGEISYYLADKYRLPEIAFIAALFVGLVLYFGRLRGLTSMIGLTFSIFVLIGFTIPQIIANHNPLTICLISAFVIAVVSIYLAHGFNKRTSIAVAGTLLTLALSVLLASFFVHLTQLTGSGTEETFYLQTEASQPSFDFQGLLLGGIIISLLGILDDVTTGQASTIDEIAKADPSLSFTELYKRGLSVGREHIASLVNTLVLVYAGASLPLFLILAAYPDPLWYTMNSEFLAEEIVRTLTGSIALVLAVPITNFLAAYFLRKNNFKKY